MSDHPELRIRPADESDVSTIVRLIRALAEYERMADQVTVDEGKLLGALFGDHRFAEVLIGEVEGKAIGFAVFFHNFSTFRGRTGIYLEDLFVDPEYRSRGYGRALLRAVAAVANERGCDRLDWAVLDWNDPAIGFYRRFGARALDDWTIFRLSGDALRDFAT